MARGRKPEGILAAVMRAPLDRGNLSRWILFAVSGLGAFWITGIFVLVSVARFIFGTDLYADNGLIALAPLVVAYSFTIASAFGRGNGRVVLNTLIFNIIAMIQFVLSAIGAVLYLTYISPPYWDCLLGNTLTGTELLICEEQQWVRHSVYWSVIAVVPISVVAFAATAYDAVSIWSQRYKKITEPINATIV